MEDALISPAGFMILSGAGLTEASTQESIIVHATEQTDQVKVKPAEGDITSVEIELNEIPYFGKDANNQSLEAYGTYSEDLIYVMVLDDNGEVSTEPFIPSSVTVKDNKASLTIEFSAKTALNKRDEQDESVSVKTYTAKNDSVYPFKAGCVVLVDYYVEKKAGAQQIDITPDKFGGNYYLEASTLFRTTDGVDMPAEFIIPNCKIQSNFTFTMASSGDPSSFTFTMDAFPDYTRFDKTKKVLAAIQIIDEGTGTGALRRASTTASDTHKEDATTGAIVEK